MTEIQDLINKAKTDQYEVCIWGAGFIGTGYGLKLLHQQGIKVDYYCDNNLKLLGKNIVDGIKCESQERLFQNKDRTICFLIMRSDYIGEVYSQLNKNGIFNIVTYQDLLDMDTVVESYYPFMKRNQIAIYTCIVGDYDRIYEPVYISANCDYYLISDKKPKKETIYKFIDIQDVLPPNIEDSTRMNRYVKINAHKIFSQYKYSIYIDGNIVITGDMSKLIYELPKTRIAVAGESYWDNIYVEGIRCIESKRDKKDIIMKQVEQYWLQGMPEHFGSFLCNVLIREHNNPICVKLMEDWWKELSNHSRRDQISFPYVLWKNGFTSDDVKTLAPKPGFISDYWIFEHEHNSHRIKDKKLD